MEATLTDLEAKVLREMHAESGSNGHDFGIMELVSVPGLNRKQLGAVVTNLVTKGIVTVHPTEKVEGRPVTQYVFGHAAGIPYFKALGLEVPHYAEEDAAR